MADRQMTADYYIFIILILSHRHFKMWHHKSKMAARRGDKPGHSGTTVKSKQANNISTKLPVSFFYDQFKFCSRRVLGRKITYFGFRKHRVLA